MEKDKGLAYWIYYEDCGIYYCECCIDGRLEEVNQNKEFEEAGEECGYMFDVALEDHEVECCICGAPLLSQIDDTDNILPIFAAWITVNSLSLKFRT